MAACTDDKFVINKGMVNEFIFTIKQNDTLLPMVISSIDTEVVNEYVTIQPTYETLPGTSYVPAVPSYEGATENYVVGVTSLNNNSNVYDETTNPTGEVAQVYKITINEVVISYVNNSPSIGQNSSDLLIKLAELVNASAAVCSAVVDENKLHLIGESIGVNYTANTSDNLYIYQSQIPQNPTTGSDEVLATPESYIPTNSTIIVDLLEYIPENFVGNTNTTVTVVEGSVYSISAGGTAITPNIGGEYVVGASTSLAIVPAVSETLPEPFTLLINSVIGEVSEDFTADSFNIKIIELETNNIVETIYMSSDDNYSEGDDEATGVISIYDAANGQIMLTLAKPFVDSLVRAVGDRADYYYNKPLYKIAIDCTTLNNGNFVAKINKVYVD